MYAYFNHRLLEIWIPIRPSVLLSIYPRLNLQVERCLAIVYAAESPLVPEYKPL